MQVSVYRYNPEVDEVPQMREMSADLPAGKDLMVLDVLELLKAKDPTLSYRRSCREGVCGSDGINMNGKNGLACITPVSARISAVADVVEAMSSHRPYRPALGIEKALEEVSSKKGKFYDPHVVEALQKAIRKGNLELENGW